MQFFSITDTHRISLPPSSSPLSSLLFLLPSCVLSLRLLPSPSQSVLQHGSRVEKCGKESIRRRWRRRRKKDKKKGVRFGVKEEKEKNASSFLHHLAMGERVRVREREWDIWVNTITRGKFFQKLFFEKVPSVLKLFCPLVSPSPPPPPPHLNFPKWTFEVSEGTFRCLLVSISISLSLSLLSSVSLRQS